MEEQSESQAGSNTNKQHECSPANMSSGLE